MQTSEHENSDSQRLGQDDFRALIREKMCAAVRLTLVAVLEEELEAWVGAGRYERSTGRRDHRIGTRTRDLGTPARASERWADQGAANSQNARRVPDPAV